MPDNKYYENRSLFSDYYLEHRLTDHPEWDESIEEAHQSFQDLYQRNTDLYPKLRGKESKTEEKFIKPAFDILGFFTEVQDKAASYGELNYPDYSLFVSEEQRAEALQHLDENEYFNYPVAIADAKYWGRPLDTQFSDAEERLSNRNPSFQIVHYLVATGVEWGILTNGAVWRLYSTKARSRLNLYYEVNLQNILKSKSVDAFKYFYHFFRAASFIKSPETGTTFIERVFTGSIQYGSELQNRLKDLIFDEIFLHLAEGFIEFQQKNGAENIEHPENLDAIYEGTLRLLYRLLFLLYAEARDLLPVEERGYRKYSMMHLKGRAWEAIREGETLSSVGHDYWNDLQSLFRIIDLGDSDLNVPRYNGGLFRQTHPKNAFFAAHAVPDKYLVPALHLLTMDEDPETGEKRFIDYKTLDVEQLGSIYEGLLEFHLRIADEPLAVTKEKGREVYKPVDAVEKPLRIIEQGEPYLENDKGERKATGSYYTPDYIVQYIVENTVGPVLNDRANRFSEIMDEIHERSSGNRKQPVKQLEQEAIDTFLGIKVCDPAMGSGHFLVRATDYLAERIIAELDKYPDNPVIRQLESIRQDIIETLEEQDISIDERVLKDTNLLKRMVMKRCIYGVDLNPMATELAKLSLWLDSFTVGAPLSFLDHHLKVGNSLIGGSIGEAAESLLPDKFHTLEIFGSPFRGFMLAAEFMRDVSLSTDATFQEVEESVNKYESYERASKPYKKLLDLWISQFLGNKNVKKMLETYGSDLIKNLKKDSLSTLGTSEKKVVKKSSSIAKDFQVFHWELEFPEAFFDLAKEKFKEDPGFDAVVGNPPYVRQEQLKENKTYLKSKYNSYNGVADLYVYFIEQGVSKVHRLGHFGYIVSNKFMRANYGKAIREFLFEETNIRQIIDFGELQVFGDASTFPSILILEKNPKDMHEPVIVNVKNLEFEFLGKLVEEEGYKTSNLGLNGKGWSLLKKEISGILTIVESKSVPLKGYLNTSIHYGIKTGLNKAFFIDRDIRNRLIESDESSKKILKPLVVGDDIRKYEINFKEQFLIFTRRGIDIDKYPAIKNYLKRFKSELEPRPKHFRGSWQGRKSGSYEWYEIQDTVDYWKKFEHTKIVYPVIAKEPRFTMDKSGFYTNDKCFIIPEEDYYLLALLNSTILFEIAKLKVSVLGDAAAGGRLELREVHIRNLPIRKIEFISSDSERESGLTEFTELYEGQIESGQFGEMLKLVNEHLSASPERSDVVHDILAHLAQRMLDMHEQKQKETAGFLSWLERFMGTALDNLSGYTIIQEYYDIDGGKEELIDRLKRNNSKIPDQDMTTRAAQEKVIEEYERSMETLRPLLNRIEKTDRLIDRIVYQLYGLTEEEIRVVEGEKE